MKAMTVTSPAPVETRPLALTDLPIPSPASDEVLIEVEVCGVCRTDLHVVEGDLPSRRKSVVPGHEVIGRVAELGAECRALKIGDRVGVAWLNRACGVCTYCRRNDENLCDSPQFTGYDVDGGYAEYVKAPEAFVYPLPELLDAVESAPFLCAGIIGYRALRRSNISPGEPIGLYGFGGSAHIVLQIARHWGCPVYVCTRGESHQRLALDLGAEWAGPSDARPPVKLRSAILFAPAGPLVLPALEALDKGGTLALAGIHMSPIPEMDYMRYLFQERNLRSVTANTRDDGRALLRLAAEIPLRAHTVEYRLEDANEALLALKEDRIDGAAVIRVRARVSGSML
jgi:propanol-preferring alcohol dehydrogenase